MITSIIITVRVLYTVYLLLLVNVVTKTTECVKDARVLRHRDTLKGISNTEDR